MHGVHAALPPRAGRTVAVSESPEKSLPLNPEIEAAAADWLVKQDRGFTPEQQDAFLQWIAGSPAHRESFQRHRRMWTDFNALAQWRPEHSAVPNPDLLAKPRRSSVLRWVAPALAMAAAVAIGIWWNAVPPAAEKGVAFEATSYRQETLPDGSVLDLNRGAHVVVQFSRAERRVLLVRGEAQFVVAKNPARPFVVRAGGVDVRAVGTAFNVKLTGANLEVLVTEGTVHLSQQTSSSGVVMPSAATSAPVLLAELSAGQRTVVPMAENAASPVVVATSRPEIDQLLEWQPRLLDFDSTPLADVVAVFNRRNSRQIVIDDDSLRGLPLVASIRSDNVEGLVRQLEATMGVQVERRSGGEIILRRSR
jgi:transmembrane sensor